MMARHSLVHAGNRGYLKSIETLEFTHNPLEAKKYPYFEVWHHAKEMNHDMDVLEVAGIESVEVYVFEYDVYRR